MTQRPVRLLFIPLLLLCILGYAGKVSFSSTEPVAEVQPTGVVEKGGDFLPLDVVFTNT